MGMSIRIQWPLISSSKFIRIRAEWFPTLYRLQLSTRWYFPKYVTDCCKESPQCVCQNTCEDFPIYPCSLFYSFWFFFYNSFKFEESHPNFYSPCTPSLLHTKHFNTILYLISLTSSPCYSSLQVFMSLLVIHLLQECKRKYSPQRKYQLKQ